MISATFHMRRDCPGYVAAKSLADGDGRPLAEACADGNVRGTSTTGPGAGAR